MNIFARELARLLARNGKILGSLYGLHSPTYQLLPNKVTRLRRSLHEDITATLNAEELELVANWMKWKLDGEEMRRLRAALVAESVRHMLGGRINQSYALKLGEITLELMLGQEPDEFLTLRDELLEGVRGGIILGRGEPGALRGMADEESPQTEPDDAPLAPALESAVKTYEQGALWLEVARATSDPDARLGYLAQASALLTQAREMATNVPALAQDTRQQEWLAIIEAALTEAASLR